MAFLIVGPGEAFVTIADALAAVEALPQPLTEFQQIEVKQGVGFADVSIPAAIIPTAANPLNIVNHELDRPQVDNVDIDRPHTFFTGFEVRGDLLAFGDGQQISENLVLGKMELIGDGATAVTMKVHNNAVHPGENTGDSLLIRDVIGSVKLHYNSILVRSDGDVLSRGLVIEDSDVDGRFNIINGVAKETAFLRLVRIKNDASRTIDLDRNMYFFFGTGLVGEVEIATVVTTQETLTNWQTATGQDPNTTFEDPQHECLVDPVLLDVANSSPAIGKGEFDLDIQIDIDKTRRPTLIGSPFSHTTLGAYEEAQRITTGGKIRILELIGGISTDSITQLAVGDAGTISAAEFLRPEKPSDLDIALKNRIFIRSIPNRFVEGIIGFFDTVAGPTPAMTEALLDAKIDTMSEVGLITADGILFMRRTLYRLPFDPLSVLTTKLLFGVSLGPCADVDPIKGPDLVLTAFAEALP